MQFILKKKLTEIPINNLPKKTIASRQLIAMYMTKDR